MKNREEKSAFWFLCQAFALHRTKLVEFLLEFLGNFSIAPAYIYTGNVWSVHSVTYLRIMFRIATATAAAATTISGRQFRGMLVDSVLIWVDRSLNRGLIMKITQCKKQIRKDEIQTRKNSKCDPSSRYHMRRILIQIYIFHLSVAANCAAWKWNLRVRVCVCAITVFVWRPELFDTILDDIGCNG